MRVIGLCGGSGSGKGTVAKIFERYQVQSIDTDAVYHKITSGKSDCLDELEGFFGRDIIGEDGGLDRRALGKIVFAEDGEKKRSVLNRIAHKHVLIEVRKMLDLLRSQGHRWAIVDAPMLFESGFNAECDSIVCVIADRNVRISRITERDGISPEAASARIASQLSDERLAQLCDYKIVNNGDLAELEASVADLAEKILN